MNDSQFNIRITTRASDPNVALSALDDIVAFTDQIVANFSTNKFIETSDLPLIVDGNHFDDTEPYSYHMTLWNDDTEAADPPVPTSRYSNGSKVYHLESGQSFVVRARVYYHIGRRWFYILIPEDDPEPVQLPEEDLMHEQTFLEFAAHINEATGKVWTWNPKIRRFQTGHHGIQKLNLNDVRNVLQSCIDKEECPF